MKNGINKNRLILIVDDEAPMRHLLQLYLQADGYQTDSAANGKQALEKLKNNNFDLVVLDLMMPEMDGFDVCKSIRNWSTIPIIMLTARDEMIDKVIGLKLGADDYITKPFEQNELLARLESIFRRVHFQQFDNTAAVVENPAHLKTILNFHQLKMNVPLHQVFYSEHKLAFTPKEFAILRLFLSNKGRLFHREDVLELLWGTSQVTDDRTVDTHIKNIRNKLIDVGMDGHKVIKTIWGTGYICNENN
ncbi:response regulator transcription factor [Paenibacillus sp. LHD-38]|uniref:response regulator transcription factor n=1 Tax=Paenibacillus sp. LHD-38 TaxID=3072143 RepID=UPI00280CF66D|nr:response regulator transcription factor [Paenibacillus sp. LHD-38]MDQ8734861.1 response regulator transcription factor [Paenibacillus sp. LHD-38]